MQGSNTLLFIQVMKVFSSFIFSLLLILSCKEKKEYHIETNVLMFEAPRTTKTIRHFFKKDIKYYYTFELSSLNKAFIFDESGNPKCTLDLNDFINKNHCDLKDLYIINFDSIIAYSVNNLFFLIDSSKRILKTYNYFKNYCTGEHITPGILHVKGNYLHTAVSPMYVKRTFKNWRDENIFLNSSPVVSKINLQNSEISFYGKNLKRRIFKDDERNFSFVRYLLTSDNKFIYLNPFSDTLYEISSNNKIRPILKVESKIGNIKLPKISYLEFENNSNKYMPRLYAETPHLDWLIEDTIRHLWYLIVCKKRDSEGRTPFNIIVYNKNWQKLDESEFKSTQYKYGTRFVTEKGLYIERVNKDRRSNKRIFDCLVYEKQ